MLAAAASNIATTIGYNNGEQRHRCIMQCCGQPTSTFTKGAGRPPAQRDVAQLQAQHVLRQHAELVVQRVNVAARVVDQLAPGGGLEEAAQAGAAGRGNGHDGWKRHKVEQVDGGRGGKGELSQAQPAMPAQPDALEIEMQFATLGRELLQGLQQLQSRWLIVADRAGRRGIGGPERRHGWLASCPRRIGGDDATGEHGSYQGMNLGT